LIRVMGESEDHAKLDDVLASICKAIEQVG
jgi:hypothetical protein